MSQSIPFPLSGDDATGVPSDEVKDVEALKEAKAAKQAADEAALDDKLVDAAQQGDTEAFDQLVVKYSPRLYGLVYHMTSNADDSSDLLQDIFAKAYRSIPKFRKKSTFYTWIYTIAVNMTLNFLKRRKKRNNVSYDNIDTGIQNDSVFVDISHHANPRKQTTIHELQKKLNIAMQALSEDHRAVVTMFDIQGMPHAEISKILGVTVGTIRSRLFYAHQQMRGYLEEFYYSSDES